MFIVENSLHLFLTCPQLRPFEVESLGPEIIIILGSERYQSNFTTPHSPRPLTTVNDIVIFQLNQACERISAILGKPYELLQLARRYTLGACLNCAGRCV
jgi:hypothetical protein